MEVEKFIPLLKEISKEAGQEILKIYHSDDFKIRSKSDESPVTRADLAAHKIILKQLQPTGFPILSEEGKQTDYAIRKTWEYFWLIDPLDGTKEFIKQNGEFTVNIALIHQNQPILGIVYVPVSDELFYGGEQIGAFKEIDDREIKLKKSPSRIINKRVLVSRSHINQETKNYLERLNNPVTIRMGSSLKFMQIADGKADIYPRFSPCMEWDSAASDAILRGMNIAIINPKTKKPLIYNKKSLVNPYFIVS